MISEKILLHWSNLGEIKASNNWFLCQYMNHRTNKTLMLCELKNYKLKQVMMNVLGARASPYLHPTLNMRTQRQKQSQVTVINSTITL